MRHNVSGATRYFTDAMKELGMGWSTSKHAVVAPCKDIALAIIAELPHLKIKFVRRPESLGGALGGGTNRNVQVQRGRLNASKVRTSHFQKFCRMAGAKASSKVLRTEGIAAVVCSNAHIGASNSLLH